ncbi:hypothetical protein PQG02_11225 [Nostoc sp. UHCC 0926]|uniref:hypothetical protein n=1 Tax=unclassified Nostoc TaxID=2593658 RepID=UPI0023618C00|nr:hypothetical protein [Nostoc sp. UHCC 0926]WDD34843.1 hypothetical protein PQG02_11225 [Nostoc sp. UHCC 0926]
MKGFRKLSSIALLLCAFVYPPSLAEAKDISLSNVHNEQSAAPEANLVGDKTGELLIARRQIIRRRERFRRYENFRRRERFGGHENFRRRERFERYENNRRRERFQRYENNRRRY